MRALYSESTKLKLSLVCCAGVIGGATSSQLFSIILTFSTHE